jgi:hypothetical protein
MWLFGYFRATRFRNSNKTVSEKGTVSFFLAESEKLGQSPTVLLEFFRNFARPLMLAIRR